jgi:hypothetical protein
VKKGSAILREAGRSIGRPLYLRDKHRYSVVRVSTVLSALVAGAIAGRAANVTVTTRPVPTGASDNLTSAPLAIAISRTIGSPNPHPSDPPECSR